MRAFPIFVALRGRPVILLGDGEAAAAKRRLLERAGAVLVGEDAEARLAIVALVEPDAAVARLRARGVLVNAVDRPDLCDFTLPAIVDRDPVTVAIGTGGVSAGLAAALRQRLETLLPAGLGALAEALHGFRARVPDAAERRRRLAPLLAAGGALDPLAPAADPTAVLASAAAPPPRLERIAVASPDPDLLTLRDARLLGRAERLHHPADMPAAILDRARADAVRIVGPAPALAEAGLTVELVWAR